MASFDPYAPCPCGSSRKYKWCCQKSEDHALRVSRMIDNEQYDQARRVVEEGLRKRPGTFWLLSLKADLLYERGQIEEAVRTLESILEQDPGHARALGQLLYYKQDARGAREAVEQLQRCFDAAQGPARENLFQVFELVGSVLFAQGFLLAGLAHLRLAERSGIALREELPKPIDLLGESIPIAFKWEHPWAETPDGLEGPPRERFEEALQQAKNGHWASAAEAFRALAAEGVEPAKRNAGLCHLYFGDEMTGGRWLMDWLEHAEPTLDAVETEALVQELIDSSDEIAPDLERLEYVELRWPLRDEAGLSAALRRRWQEDPRVGRHLNKSLSALDASEEIDDEDVTYHLLDRPKVADHPDPDIEEFPRILGRVYIDREAGEVALAGLDDGAAFDQLKDRFLEIAEPYIPPAHPKTETVGSHTWHDVELKPDLQFPDGMDARAWQRFFVEVARFRHFKRWPELPDPRLDGKTPRQAAESGGYTIPLRGRILRFELESGSDPTLDYDTLRAELGLEPEPPVMLENNNPLRYSFLRQHLIPFDRRSIHEVWLFFSMSAFLKLRVTHQRSLENLLSRPNELATLKPEWRRSIYRTRAALAGFAEGYEAALEWLERGRDEEPDSHRPDNAQLWDLEIIRYRAQHEPEERWVPELIRLVQNFQLEPARECESDQERQEVTQYRQRNLLSTLAELGLVRVVPRSEDPGDIALDTRALEELTRRYNSSLTTPTGEPASASAQPTIWTPEQTAGRSGGIWTPGGDAGSQSGPTPRKIITPDD